MKALITLLLVSCLPVCAATGALQGIVHDPQHRPIPGAEIVIQGQTIQSNSDGEFRIDKLPEGSYQVTVSARGFETLRKSLTVTAGKSPVVHLQLEISPMSESIEVAGASSKLQAQTSTVQTLVTPREIAETPGADQTNSLAMITDFTPGAYMVHDMLHMRGGHQVNWFFDGIPVVNTNIAANVAPLINPKNVEELEVERGRLFERVRRPDLRFLQHRDPLGIRTQQPSRADNVRRQFLFDRRSVQHRRAYPAVRLLCKYRWEPFGTRTGYAGVAGDPRSEQRRRRISVALVQSQFERSGALDRFVARGSLPDPQRRGHAVGGYPRSGSGAGRV